jgi:hypothetical protein
MFVGKVSGKAEEAINFYLSVFKNSKLVYRFLIKATIFIQSGLKCPLCHLRVCEKS